MKITFAAPVELQAAASEGSRPSFTIAAYTGVPMRVAGSSLPVVVDLAGLKASSQELPILLDHDPTQIVGMASGVTIDKQGVNLAGTVTGDDGASAKVITHARNGFKWKASIGAQVTRKEFLQAGSSAKVNGREVVGPLIIARAAELVETSFVAIGADSNTSAFVAATLSKDQGTMDFEQWLNAKGWDGASLNEGQLVTLKAAYEAEPKSDTDTDLESVLAAGRADRERIGAISRITASALADYPSRAQEIETLSRLAASAGWTTDRYELEMLRAMRTAQVKPWSNTEAPKADVIEAALAMSCGLNDPEKHYSEQTLEAANKRYRHGIGLKEVLLIAARQNGEYMDLGTRNIRGLLKAAFDVRASSPYSTLSLPTLFSNVSNKIALDAFNSVENEWEKISAVGPVSDFKQTTSFSLTGDLTYEEIGPTGELKHGTLGEEVYHNQAKSYGKLLGLSRVDLINDDQGALNRVPKRLGRGGALAVNDKFWTVFQANTSFFTTARGNYDEGADTAFDSTSLAAADLLFRSLTDPDGKPLGTTPKILLVPSALRIAALRLMNSQQVFEDSAEGGANPWAGAFQVVSSQYLTSAKKWYLLGDPNDLPVVETVFLDGRRAPLIEAVQPTPDFLGIVYQAVHDFGVALQEYRGGIAMKGEV